jgi:hypothetical protein
VSKKDLGVGPGQPYGTGNRLKETEPSVHKTNTRDKRGIPVDVPQFAGHGGPKS